MTNRYNVSLSERIISVISYVTMGFFGFLYVIYLFFAKKKLSYFLKYNISQAVFISFLFFVISMVLGLLLSILSHIPIIQLVVSWLYVLFNKSVIYKYSIIQIFMFCLSGYMAVFSGLGKYPKVFWVSKTISESFR